MGMNSIVVRCRSAQIIDGRRKFAAKQVLLYRRSEIRRSDCAAQTPSTAA